MRRRSTCTTLPTRTIPNLSYVKLGYDSNNIEQIPNNYDVLMREKYTESTDRLSFSSEVQKRSHSGQRSSVRLQGKTASDATAANEKRFQRLCSSAEPHTTKRSPPASKMSDKNHALEWEQRTAELLKNSGLLDHHSLGYETTDALVLRSRETLRYNC